jgi:uncharacterized circularly permuted ATP-grasp superfamily protein
MKTDAILDNTAQCLLDSYDLGDYYDEMFAAPGQPRPHYQKLAHCFQSIAAAALDRRQNQANSAFRTRGVTFAVYGSEEGTEKIFPFDLVPRIIPSTEWSDIERGLTQRLYALNQFIADIYSHQTILRDGVVPKELIFSSSQYRPQFRGMSVPGKVYVHLCGTDLIRDADGTYRVLEDNLRVPSGVSYVLENRRVMKQVFGSIFTQHRVRGIMDYPLQLLRMMRKLAPSPDPVAVVLTPGTYNSAYFEHAFLALQMGAELVEGRDLVVENDCVWAKTIHGLRQVHAIYRRIDDDFLDPEVFRSDSALGVPGLMRAYAAGNVLLANGIGTGVADDKVIYKFVPDIIRYYLGEDAILSNVETYLASDEKERSHILTHLETMVVKECDNAGGYGMLIGPTASQAELDEFRGRIQANPRKYLAQPVVKFSRHPTFSTEEKQLYGCHIDLRPYILNDGEGIWVLPGGLTRVALKKGSLVVNSSQGGGSKDTWVLENDPVN